MVGLELALVDRWAEGLVPTGLELGLVRWNSSSPRCRFPKSSTRGQCACAELAVAPPAWDRTRFWSKIKVMKQHDSSTMVSIY